MGISARSDARLFTPGPLNTSDSIKRAMLLDVGSRDVNFINIVADIRRRIVSIGTSAHEHYTAILMQGSGTMGVEAMIGSIVPPNARLLVLINGAYGQRIAKIAQVLSIKTVILERPEDQVIRADDVLVALDQEPQITHVVAVHCETTTGILNPVLEIGKAVARAGRVFLVDAMSSFGGIPLDLADARIDALVSSSNKCIEGVPGFSFVLVRKSLLPQMAGISRSLALDLHGQYVGFERDGQFRFTPPTHALLAFHQALIELEHEGGVPARSQRYARNHEIIVEGMQKLGFQEYLSRSVQSHIITTYRYPEHPAFDFTAFYNGLARRDCLIYPGKLTTEPCFRIGNIGQLFPEDMAVLLQAIPEVLEEMGVSL